MFIALLLSSFDSSNLNSEDDEDDNKIEEAVNRIKRFFKFLFDKIRRLCCRKSVLKEEIKQEEKEAEVVEQLLDKYLSSYNKEIDKLKSLANISVTSGSISDDEDITDETVTEIEKQNNDSIKTEEAEISIEEPYPPPCFPELCLNRFKCCNRETKFTKIRKIFYKIVESDPFETFILILILLSSAALVIIYNAIKIIYLKSNYLVIFYKGIRRYKYSFQTEIKIHSKYFG